MKSRVKKLQKVQIKENCREPWRMEIPSSRRPLFLIVRGMEIKDVFDVFETKVKDYA